MFSYVFAHSTRRARIRSSPVWLTFELEWVPTVRSGFVKERLYIGEAIAATMFGVAFS